MLGSGVEVEAVELTVDTIVVDVRGRVVEIWVD